MFNNLKQKNKLGFSLLEVCVTMGIMAIFIAACTNVFTQKYKGRIALPTHGHYECYYDESGNLRQLMYYEDQKVMDETLTEGQTCRFSPPKNSSYLIVTAVGAGGHGGTTYGGSAGDYTNSFISGTTHNIEIIPGKAADDTSTKSGTTFVYDIGESGNEPRQDLMQKEGGRNDSSKDLWLKDCRITYAEKSCYITPYCSLFNDEKYIEIEYCAKNDNTGTDISAEASVKIDYINSGESTVPPLLTNQPTSEGGISYDYKDEKGNYMFTFVVEVDGNYTANQERTPLEGYIKSLKLDKNPVGIGTLTIPPGTGGAKDSKGGDGAVLISW